MKTLKMLLVLISFTLMSTGCRHDHEHDEHSSKQEKSGHSQERKDEKHRH